MYPDGRRQQHPSGGGLRVPLRLPPLPACRISTEHVAAAQVELSEETPGDVLPYTCGPVVRLMHVVSMFVLSFLGTVITVSSETVTVEWK